MGGAEKVILVVWARCVDQWLHPGWHFFFFLTPIKAAKCFLFVQLWPLFGGRLTKPHRSKLFYIPQVSVTVLMQYASNESGTALYMCSMFWSWRNSCSTRYVCFCEPTVAVHKLVLTFKTFSIPYTK